MSPLLSTSSVQILNVDIRREVVVVLLVYVHGRAREIDKCFTETTDRPFPRSWKLPIGSFRNDRPFPNIR